jgi:DNA-binding NtrC family response regulator
MKGLHRPVVEPAERDDTVSAKPEFLGGPTLKRIEQEFTLERLKRLHYNKTATAKSLGISLKTLYNRLARYKQMDAAQSQEARL